MVGSKFAHEELKIHKKDFLGDDGEQTLSYIECTNEKDIEAYSHFESEEEILFVPGTCLRMIGKLNPSEGLHIVHLQEVPQPYKTIAPSFNTSSVSTNPSSIKPSIISKEFRKVSAAAGMSAKVSDKTLRLTLWLSLFFLKEDTEIF